MNKWIAIPIIIALIAGCSTLSLLYFQESNKIKDAEAEISSLESTLSAMTADLEDANDALLVQKEIHTALADELRQVGDPRHFATLTELVDWLAQDDTNIVYAHKSLEELAFILQVRALRDGYLLPACFEDFNVDYLVDNIGNLAYIGDKIWMVLPKDDTVFTWADVRPIPSHPLPLD